MKHKLHDRCSNNQAAQMAVVKALQAIQTIKINKNVPRKIIIHTDSRITLDSLKNNKNHKHLIEEIRKKTITLEKENWNIEYTWIKAHAGHCGDELADNVAKEATRNSDICYNKFPKSETEHQEREKSMEKCNNNGTTQLKDLQPENFSRTLRTG